MIPLHGGYFLCHDSNIVIPFTNGAFCFYLALSPCWHKNRNGSKMVYYNIDKVGKKMMMVLKVNQGN